MSVYHPVPVPPGPTGGIDWASDNHAVCVVDGDGQALERLTVTHTAAGLRAMTGLLIGHRVEAVAIERPDGPVVDALLAAGLTVYVIPPSQVRNLRGRYGSAGNKDDRFDAFVLADTLRTDRRRLTPLALDTEATTALRKLCRARRDLVAAANQLRAHLQGAFPGAVGLFEHIDSQISLRFLSRFPTQDAADWLTPKRLATWLAGVGYSGRTPAAVLHARLAAATRGATEGHALTLAGITAAYLAVLATISAQIQALAQQITHALAAHPDSNVFTSLPRAGTVRAARLLAEIGRRPRPVPHPQLAGVPGRRGTLDPRVRQGAHRLVPVGCGQTTARRGLRLRRRQPPRQPVGRRAVQPGTGPRARPPPRRTNTRPSLAQHHLEVLDHQHCL